MWANEGLRVTRFRVEEHVKLVLETIKLLLLVELAIVVGAIIR